MSDSIKYILPKDGNFYKANLHTHTTVSDGKLTPEEAKARFKSMGYSVVAFTDHELMVPHPELAEDDFLPLTGYEMSIDSELESPYKRTYHLNYYSPDPMRSASRTMAVTSVWNRDYMQAMITDEMRRLSTGKRVYSKEFIQSLIDFATEEGALMSYNHPVWSLQTKDDYSGLKGLFGVEWANSGCNIMGYFDTMQPIEDLNSEGERMCYPLAADDCHKDTEYGFSWVNIKSKSLEYGEIFEALRRGDFYSSTGPEILEAYVEGTDVVVTTSPAAGIFLATGNRQRQARRMHDEPLTKARFSIERMYEKLEFSPDKSKLWFRIDVLDEKGNFARTRAVFLDELGE
ncbi:MAG: hypothetical protein IJY18_06465 [Clostridia bacterium]|nr:hypothetical protein [Clostridia bacterium]